MMKLKDYSLLLALCLLAWVISAQNSITINVVDANNLNALKGAEVYNVNTTQTYSTNADGFLEIKNLASGKYELIAFVQNYQTFQEEVTIANDQHIQLTFKLSPLEVDLSTVFVDGTGESTFTMRQLRAVEGTSIYAGKKTEVVMLDKLTANLASNNARQIYSQVTGLNIYESEDAGLQLSVGGRGLDPNRTASFNTRQNGYDISADVLGYPESYYTPPAEALQQIQVVRGAASLQYGTQFGGLLNFIFKEPNQNKKIEWTSRQTGGSFGLFTSFNSLSGTIGKFSYYTYFNYKRGDGFRPNAGFDAYNYFTHLSYAFSEKTSLDIEFTYLNYLAQQAGGLTDAQFYSDPGFSNRNRNWFEVDWHLLSAKLEHRFSAQTNASLNIYGLDAARKAVGFRTNRVSQQDDVEAARDLLSGTFQNWGIEARLIHRYKLRGKTAVALIGAKLYNADNTAIQGPGSASNEPDFELATASFPYYASQSDFRFPNFNAALFGEHIIYLNDKLTVTPGIRVEHIRTQSEGTYRKIDFDLAGNPIRDQLFEDNRSFNRNFALLGLGLSYKPSDALEIYSNWSQNYRSVTFSDIRVVNPSFQVDPEITDESGFTADLGFRGKWKNFAYNLTAYGLLYNDRLGEVLRAETRETAEGEIIETGKIIRFRGNIGRAFIYGLESLVEWKILQSQASNAANYQLSVFSNSSLTDSKYLESETAGVTDNKVEFIPTINLKTGLRFRYNGFEASLQYTYLSKQYTDASNAEQDRRDNQSGITGAIPAYDIVDCSLAYQFWKYFKLEGGINNALNSSYFTRRATGYPGPGIIPAAPRSFYLGLEMVF